MDSEKSKKQLFSWVRSQHLICSGQNFIFETIDQAQLERFENCIKNIGGEIESVRSTGNWPMGPRRSFKILKAQAIVPRPGGIEIQAYWAKYGSFKTRFAEINC